MWWSLSNGVRHIENLFWFNDILCYIIFTVLNQSISLLYNEIFYFHTFRSVGFMFMFSFFLMLFCTLWYVVGIHLHFVCRDLKDASIFDTIIADKLNLQLETDSAMVSVQSTLNNCRNNMALYQSIGGQNVFNLSSKLDFKSVR